jgi:hypothetical protein
MLEVVAETATLFDELQRHLLNSWWGVVLAGTAAAVVFAGKIADALKKLIELFWRPAAELTIQALRVGPLPEFRHVPVGGARDSVYAVGAQVEFNLRHDGRDQGEIRIDHIEVKLDDFGKSAACPFTLTGDHFFGAGSAPVKVYRVGMSESGVTSVQYTDAAGNLHRGKTDDILALDPPVKLTLHKSEADSVETVQITIWTYDPGLYKLSILLDYSTPKSQEKKKVTSLSICTP